MVAQSTIKKAVELLLSAAPVGTKVILFGSYAEGNQNEESDLDFLVVEPIVERRRAEMVRLRQVLRPLGIPVDVLVVSVKVFDAWKDQPNNVIHEAARHGQVFTNAA